MAYIFNSNTQMADFRPPYIPYFNKQQKLSKQELKKCFQSISK